MTDNQSGHNYGIYLCVLFETMTLLYYVFYINNALMQVPFDCYTEKTVL